MSHPPARSVKPAEIRMEEILDAAQALFAQKGYNATSVQEIIDTVGIAKGTFYHYFRSKLELLDAVVERLGAQGLQELEALVDDPALDAARKLQQLFLQSNLWKLRHRSLLLELLRVMYRPQNAVFRERLQQVSMATAIPLVARIIRQGVAEGTFQVEDPEEVAAIVLGMGQFLGDALAQMILEEEQGPEFQARLERKVRTYEQSVERVLGAAPGSVRLLSADMLAPWLASE